MTVMQTYFEIWQREWHCANCRTLNDLGEMLGVIYGPFQVPRSVTIHPRRCVDASAVPETEFLAPVWRARPPLHLGDIGEAEGIA